MFYSIVSGENFVRFSWYLTRIFTMNKSCNILDGSSVIMIIILKATTVRCDSTEVYSTMTLVIR